MIVLLYHLCAFSTGIFLDFKQGKADKKEAGTKVLPSQLSLEYRARLTLGFIIRATCCCKGQERDQEQQECL